MVTAFNSKSFNTFSHSLFHLNDNLGFGLYIFSIGYRRGMGPRGSSLFVWLPLENSYNLYFQILIREWDGEIVVGVVCMLGGHKKHTQKIPNLSREMKFSFILRKHDYFVYIFFLIQGKGGREGDSYGAKTQVFLKLPYYKLTVHWQQV